MSRQAYNVKVLSPITSKGVDYVAGQYLLVTGEDNVRALVRDGRFDMRGIAKKFGAAVEFVPVNEEE